ncbi:MAG: RNA polymerase sigma-70 factor [Bacteroidales bacterium]|nr:RNA polymerase sigma-70 factor [Bacteroidales bacterium]MBN2633380.1 RNA polymerase sigma-70 factor [Bacteroidales bacterium]
MNRDNEMIRRIRKGDRKQFESLFRSSYISLVKYAKTFVKDHDTAEEIVQDLFVRLWNDRQNLKIKSSLNGYLFRAVHNRCLRHLEHNRVKERYERDMTGKQSVEYGTPEEILKFNELQLRITGILEKLPERCVQIFCMNRFEGLKYHEIAGRLEISVKTVETDMGKALKEFRKELNER